MTRALIPVTDGVEEMEAVIVIDTLRRAQWDVVCAGMNPGMVTASRGVRIVPDTSFDRLDPSTFDAIIVPGGSKGVERLLREKRLREAIRHLHRAGKIVAAICAGPLVLQRAGVLSGKKATCHPDLAAKMTRAQWSNEIVVIDGNVITSQGAGTCFQFALAIISKVDGPEKSRMVARGMVFDFDLERARGSPHPP
jgi:DJ-1 family protein